MRRNLSHLFMVFYTMLYTGYAQAQHRVNPDEIKEKMQWFANGKLGIFIHYGIYSVKGIDESWSFHNKKISYPDYMNQLKGFTANQYKPDELAELIKESGARYAVMTTKHHDGVALWNSKYGSLNVVKKTPAKKDLLKPLYDALRARGIKAGAYFSLIDWSHADYPGFLKDSSRYKVDAQPAKWAKYLTFMNGQLDELAKQYNPDLWWFDGDWEHSADEWKASAIRQKLLSYNPNAIINGRLQGFGDYDTPEQNFPVSRPNYKWWELCMTINDNWGYQPQDTNFKTPYEIISIFTDAVSYGGNLLLDIGPKGDGSIPPQEVNMLKELGAWNKKNGEGVFNTVAGMPQGHYYGASTLSKDSTTVYLFVPAKTSAPVLVKGLKNSIKKITVLGSETPLNYKIVGKISWSAVPGLLYIPIPESKQDKYMSVIKIELNGKLDLYRGKGGFLTNE
ncbi:alpha-L-fucosidase [Mucilaginibacter gossypii]|uniref:alpha-L-fucosidase n=1 Tax=Mucilaginibacter gossypii TaxID=551996 RepID=UPI000DCF4ACA|nr:MULTISPECIES: alpha-L-fucosidase [Mucilaginibacter]QTE40543.2 alpha-L-fucosidase [Mucilaginibacter gossypii]RAV48630.1 alpha-L-fucosidase [Mucilaginibacter rubeus]